MITLSVNHVLELYGRPAITRSIRAQLMGVPDLTNSDVFHNWANLPIAREQFAREASEQMQARFTECQPLPGAEKLLFNLSRAHNTSTGDKIELALASSSKTHSYKLKRSQPKTKRLLDFFQSDRRVLGDVSRVEQGRAKPAPDIFAVALHSTDSAKNSGKRPIMSNECLVFEDSVVGVESGRRAGIRVVWVPHPDVALDYQSEEKNILAGRTGMFEIGDDWQEVNAGWAEGIPSLENFDYERYGIKLNAS